MTERDLLSFIKGRIDQRLNDLLVDTGPGCDDSITGINDAWDVVRAVLDEEIRKAST